MDPKLSKTRAEQLEASDISSSDENIDSPPPATGVSNQTDGVGGRTFTTDNGGFPWRDVTILENGSPVYFADVSQYTRNTPDMVWYYRDKNGPVVGHTFTHWIRSIKCGIGPDETSMEWVEMQRGGFANSKRYQFEWDSRSYLLCRSNFGGKSGQYHVLDEERKDVIAKHEAKLTFRTRRNKTLTFAPGIDERL